MPSAVSRGLILAGIVAAGWERWAGKLLEALRTQGAFGFVVRHPHLRESRPVLAFVARHDDQRLVHYIYIPLGGNRRRQARNILAAFAVSTVWHWMGIPFFAQKFTVWDFAPILMWGPLNAAGVVGYVLFRKRGRQLLPARPPLLVRRGIKIFLTACLSTFTVTLLGFRPQNIQMLAPFLRHLVGLSN
jgi:hypothetical protein